MAPTARRHRRLGSRPRHRSEAQIHRRSARQSPAHFPGRHATHGPTRRNRQDDRRGRASRRRRRRDLESATGHGSATADRPPLRRAQDRMVPCSRRHSFLAGVLVDRRTREHTLVWTPNHRPTSSDSTLRGRRRGHGDVVRPDLGFNPPRAAGGSRTGRHRSDRDRKSEPVRPRQSRVQMRPPRTTAPVRRDSENRGSKSSAGSLPRQQVARPADSRAGWLRRHTTVDQHR